MFGILVPRTNRETNDLCREKAYTLWNQKTGARTSNYGSRVDFILATGPGADLPSPAAALVAEMNSPAAATDATRPATQSQAVLGSPAAGILQTALQLALSLPLIQEQEERRSVW